MTKLAILQMADEPQILSTAVMLRACGYEIVTCGSALRDALIRIGCDTVLAPSRMEALGYDKVDPSIGEADIRDLERCDLFVEIKVRNAIKIMDHWKHLRDKTLYWRVNGAQPEICPKGGDEVNLPCPIVTACLWYGTPRYCDGKTTQSQSIDEHLAGRSVTLDDHLEEARSIEYHATDPDSLAYVFWPPYPKSENYDKIDRRVLRDYNQPYSLAHSVRAWGYEPIIDSCSALGVRIFGNNAPNGQIPHNQVHHLTKDALCLVHLKSVDCPGWALYEAMLSGCPVVTGRLLNSRMLAYDLLKHGDTCFEFGVPASLEYGRGDMAYDKCLEDIKVAIEKLRNPETNYEIGENGRARLKHLMWNIERDRGSFKTFMENHFG